MSPVDWLAVVAAVVGVGVIARLTLVPRGEKRSPYYYYYRYGRWPKSRKDWLTLEESQLPMPEGPATGEWPEPPRHRGRSRPKDDFEIDIVTAAAFFPLEADEAQAWEEGYEEAWEEVDDWADD